MAKLLKLRRGTTSQHSSFTGAEGEVTVDTDKDVLVVNDGSTAGGHPLAAEDMSNVSSASIVGRLGSGSITSSKIAGDAITNAKIADDQIDSEHYVDGSIDNAHLSGSCVTAAKIATNAVTTNKIADDAVNSAKIADGAINAAAMLSNNVVQEAKIQDSAIATAKIADNAVTTAKLQDMATSRILGRHDSGTGNPQHLTPTEARTILNVENGATADQTKSDIDALNINADQVDGLEASQFIRSDGNDEATGQIRLSYNSAYPLLIDNSSNAKMSLQGTNDPYIQFKEGTTDKAYIQWNSGGWFQLTNQETSESLRIKSGNNGLVFFEGGGEYKVFHAGNDGSGSGLDADTVDGIQGANFLRSDTGDTASGDITFTGGAGAVFVEAASDIRINGGTWTGEYTTGIKLQPDGNNSYFQYEGNLYHRNTGGNNRLTLDQSGNLTAVGNVTAYSDAKLKTDIHTINDALGICGKLRGVSYKWIADGKPSIGVIAQEVEEVLPELVLTNQDVNPVTQEITEVKSVDYGKIVGVLINAINELKAEVDELKGGK